MKSVKIIICLCLLFSVLLLPLAAYSYVDEQRQIESFVRLHIRANSDSEADQTLKIAVRDSVLKKTTGLLSGCESKHDAKKILNENMPLLIQTAKDIVRENGFSYDVSAAISNEWFERREYDGFFLPQGFYDAFIMEIGSGKGHNWWCVLYPCVCLSASSGDIETDTEKVPDRFRTASSVSDGEIRYDFWLLKFFRNLF